MKSIFKVGDRVFHIEYGWGDVIEDSGGFNFPIKVRFTKGEENIFSFTYDGCETTESHQGLLSLTEYTLQGFSQERPILLPEVGELCLVRDHGNESWSCGEFQGYYAGSSLFEVKVGIYTICRKHLKRIKILD